MVARNIAAHTESASHEVLARSGNELDLNDFEPVKANPYVTQPDVVVHAVRGSVEFLRTTRILRVFSLRIWTLDETSFLPRRKLGSED